MLASAGTSVSSRLSVNSSDHSGRSSCLFLFFGFLDYRVGFPALECEASSHRKLAGLGEVLDESCGNGVKDDLALELHDNPGTATGTKFSVLHRIIVPFLVRCGF